MNNFFVNIGKTVEAKIPHVDKLFSDFLGEPNEYSITLNDCTSVEIGDYIDKLNASKASGPFSVPTNILKNNKEVLLQPLTVVINKSISEGVFPNLLKSATVCPIYKKVIKCFVPTIGQFRYCQTLGNYLNVLCIIGLKYFSMNSS